MASSNVSLWPEDEADFLCIQKCRLIPLMKISKFLNLCEIITLPLALAQ